MRSIRLQSPPDTESSVLIKWGDPLFNDSPAFDPEAQTAAAQAKQFGYNNDWMDYFPLPAFEVKNPGHGLLAVNLEYTNPELMFRNWVGFAGQSAEQTAIELEALGLAVVEVMRSSAGDWSYIPGSRYNRRVTATTMFEVTGPAAGSDWLKTNADPTGRRVVGTLNNCAGGKTPWGTILSGEENFHQYFSNAGQVTDTRLSAIHTRYGLPAQNGVYPWAKHVDRFDLAKEPEGAQPLRLGDRVRSLPSAVGSQEADRARQDAARGMHRLRWRVTEKLWRTQATTSASSSPTSSYPTEPTTRSTGSPTTSCWTRVLSTRLSCNADGTGEWLPLVFGQGGLDGSQWIRLQADVLVNTRGAATRLGATRMDRPEDMECNPVTGKVYLALTNNTNRTDLNKDPMNPRAANRWGHIIEISEDEGDHTATKFFWEIFILCGDPSVAAQGTFFAGYDPRQVSSLANPDNITFDSKGNLWIATDGQPSVLAKNDGIYAVPTEGSERGFVRQLFSGVVGAEVASLVFNSDDTALFVSLQQPGEGGRWSQR